MTERAHPKRLRALIFKRDGGVCAKCKLDTEKLIDIAARADLRPSFMPDTEDKHIIYSRYWTEKFGYANRDSLWDADHIISVEEWPPGAPGINDFRNLQTLCIHCHQDKTSDHSARRAKRRKQRKKVGPKELYLRANR